MSSRPRRSCAHPTLTASIALRLGKFFGVDAQWFLNMQDYYDLEMQREVLAADLDQIITFERAA